MRAIKISISLLFVLISISSYAADTIYNGLPEIAKLNVQIRDNPIFKQAPPPKVFLLTLESEDLAKQKKFSRYQIQLLQTQSHITRYRTRETSPNNLGFYFKKGNHLIRGDGVGYGGIFMLAYQKEHSVIGKPLTDKDYFKKYEITSISDVQGKLFPLKVGNHLAFDFTGVSQEHRANNDKAQNIDNGRMIYDVIDRYDGLVTLSGREVPGNVYLIRVSRNYNNSKTFEPIYEYMFSEQLGWYVMARYYKEGRAVAIYRLIDWS